MLGAEEERTEAVESEVVEVERGIESEVEREKFVLGLIWEGLKGLFACTRWPMEGLDVEIWAGVVPVAKGGGGVLEVVGEFKLIAAKEEKGEEGANAMGELWFELLLARVIIGDPAGERMRAEGRLFLW